MTGQVWLVAVLLVVAATAVAWPVRAGRARRRAVLGSGRPPGAGRVPPMHRAPGVASRGPAGGPLLAGRRGRAAAVARPLPTRPPGRHDPAHPIASLVELAPGGSLALFLAAAIRGVRRVRTGTGQVQLLAVVLGGGTGAVLGGPVAGVVLAAYGGLAARAVRRRHAHQAADRAHRHDLDQLCALAADLRAGLPVGAGLGEGTGPAIAAPGLPGAPGLPDSSGLAGGPRRIARMARAAVRLADRTGAPLAELLERVEADARAADRGLAAAAAQAAGARATAWLLAALPLGGIGLGYAIGVDPVAVLLHTTVGGGSAVAAVALQIGGLLWAERLGTVPGRAG
ncbi:hypothetical protein [Micromonospora sp. NPDC007230]|uniref:hypothetical protein n=1 Tax=Micromonospora sp. NPDC007230 TaxID=3364237 RepID=UPI0036CBE9E3